MKDYILSLLNGAETEKIPCTSFSGYQGTTPTKVQEEVGIFWPSAHKDADEMAELAIKSSKIMGIENIRVPFDACVEPQAMGADVNWGSKEKDPYISKYPYQDNTEEISVPEDLSERGRIPVVIEALENIQEKLDEKDDLTISATVLGPLTLVGELIGTENLLKKTITERDLIKDLVSQISKIPLKLINRYFEAGADVVQII